jgi:hypothetical protein
MELCQEKSEGAKVTVPAGLLGLMGSAPIARNQRRLKPNPWKMGEPGIVARSAKRRILSRADQKAKQKRRYRKMKKSNVYLIAALIVFAALLIAGPVSAVADVANDDASRYVAPASDLQSVGYLYVKDAVAQNIFSNDFTIMPVIDTGNVQYVNGALVSEGFTKLFAPAGDPINARLLGGGNYDQSIAPGTYIITLACGKDGNPEYAIAHVDPGQRVEIMFHGKVLSYSHHHITIIDATYYVEASPAVTHTVPAYYTVVPATYFPGLHHYNGNCDLVSNPWQHADFVANDGQRYVFMPNIGHFRYTLHPATVVIDVPAVTSGSVDVTAQLQDAVDKGITTVVFRNDVTPGGLFAADGTTLITAIDDPAPGHVKTVSVTYTNGIAPDPITKTVAEYEVLSL